MSKHVLLDPLLQAEPPVTWEEFEEICRKANVILTIGPGEDGLIDVCCQWMVKGGTGTAYLTRGQYRHPFGAFTELVLPIISTFLGNRFRWMLVSFGTANREIGIEMGLREAQQGRTKK